MGEYELTREQAVEQIGLELVEQAERENCVFCMRDDLGWERWEGRSDKNQEGDFCIAVYYMRQEETEVEDLGSCNWEIDHYEVV